MQRQQFIQHFRLSRNKLLTRYPIRLSFRDDATNQRTNLTSPPQRIGSFRYRSVRSAGFVRTRPWCDHLRGEPRDKKWTNHVLIGDLVWRRAMAWKLVVGCGFAKSDTATTLLDPARTTWSVATADLIGCNAGVSDISHRNCTPLLVRRTD
jgi:hypothetical protein